MKGILVCVDYWDILNLTLPRNAPHFDELMIVTANEQYPQQYMPDTLPRNVSLYRTDAFWRKGASFNKGLAIEEAFNALGRTGWIVVLDADIVLPPPLSLHWVELGPSRAGLAEGIWSNVTEVQYAEAGNLYNPPRRMLENPAAYREDLDWKTLPLRIEYPGEYPGYFQQFHASDPVLAKRPWYATNWRHAGGCDTDFHKRWPKERKHCLNFEVLHLGPTNVNWCGRVTPHLDGTVAPEAEERAKRLASFMRGRRQYGYSREMIE